MLEVMHWHGILAPESGIKFMPMEPISGTGFCSMFFEHKSSYPESSPVSTKMDDHF